MDWADEQGGAPAGREARGDGRPNRGAREERLETWVSRGRELVDGVSGTRPGSRPSGRGGAGRLDGLGRWVEGKLDWLLDDRDDWREPWQEEERPAPLRGGASTGGGAVGGATASLRGGAVGGAASLGGGAVDGAASRGVRGVSSSLGGGGGQEGGDRRRQRGESWAESAPPVRSARAPLEAISRRGTSPLAPTRPPLSARPVPPLRPEGPAAMAQPPLEGSGAGRPRKDGSQDWPEEDTFTIPRWRRAERQPPPPADPLAPAAPPDPPTGRPLPRSTRRR